MDGTSPVGQDKSGQGHDFTPTKFGNSNKIDLPDLTGGLPLLNTNENPVVLPGYFGSNEYRYYTVTSSGGEYYIDGDQKTNSEYDQRS